MSGSIDRLARQPKCPRCALDKTLGAGLCHTCRAQLPEHMRRGLDDVRSVDEGTITRAMRAAANYFHVHFQSVRNFGGGKRR